MRKNFLLSLINFIWLICFCSFDSSAQCLTAPFGQKPATTQTILQCNGTYQILSEGCFDGEYSKVNVSAGNTYSFKSSLTTDFITISNEAGTTAIRFGTGTISWTAPQTTVVRFYTHNYIKGECGSDNRSIKRSRQVSCTAPRQSGGVRIYQITPCSYVSSPGLPIITAITNTSATVSWPGVEVSPRFYEIEIRTSGSPFSADAGLVRKWTTVAGVTSLEITCLDPFTGYYVYVRSKCGFGASATYSAYTYNSFGTTN